MQRIGIYSGTFDPIHKGHIGLALSAIESCNLDSVVFVPEKIPRNKHCVTEFSIRMHEITNSLKPHHGLKVHDIGVDQFTVKPAIAVLQKQFPDTKITMLIGSDVAMHLHQWKDLALLLRTFSLAIGMRETETKQQVITTMSHIAELCKLEPSYTLIETVHGSISSSQYKHKKRNA
jgi:nicotinate-nucleotide adenylyltransferase